MIFIFIALVCFILIIYGISQKNLEKQKIGESSNIYNAIYSSKIKHICGLPLAEDSDCIIHLCQNQIVIDSTGNIFKLSADRIIDINIKTSKEIQNSISGAIGGAILFGPIGAFLGGTSSDVHRFFIIIYKNKENKDICISFDIKDNLNTLKMISSYIEKFNSNITKKEIDL